MATKVGKMAKTENFFGHGPGKNWGICGHRPGRIWPLNGQKRPFLAECVAIIHNSTPCVAIIHVLVAKNPLFFLNYF